MPILKDQIGRTVALSKAAERIVSLVPSLTELLYDLSAGDQVIGITKFCVHPADWKKEKTIIGGTKNPHIQAIIDLKPDLLIVSKEENRKEDIDQLASHMPIYVSDINKMSDNIQVIEQLGILLNREKEATKLSFHIQEQIQMLKPLKKEATAFYCIWKDPYMFAGTDTFIHEMMAIAGFQNVVSDNRYPELSFDELVEMQPDFMLLSSEPYPFKQSHVEALQKEMPHTKVLLVDGEMFSWYGSRPQYFADYLNSLHTVI